MHFRWAPWALALAGVAQHALMALLEPAGYVSLDMSYLVLWLAVIGAFLACSAGCGCGDCGDGGCGCCGEGCACGDCADCRPGHDGHGHEHGGHSH